jgi:hypothetical protein
MSPALDAYRGNSSALSENIQVALEQARDACRTNGSFSSECAVAWDIVEEMQAAASHQRDKTYFAQYCTDRPDAAECRVYDV